MLEEQKENNVAVLTVLSQLQQPIKYEEILKLVADMFGCPPMQVAENVVLALENGIKSGCIQKISDRYQVVPCDLF